MYVQAEKSKENSLPANKQESRAVAIFVAQKKSNVKQGFKFMDNRPVSTVQIQFQTRTYSRKPVQMVSVVLNSNKGSFTGASGNNSAVDTLLNKTQYGKDVKGLFESLPFPVSNRAKGCAEPHAMAKLVDAIVDQPNPTKNKLSNYKKNYPRFNGLVTNARMGIATGGIEKKSGEEHQAHPGFYKVTSGKYEYYADKSGNLLPCNNCSQWLNDLGASFQIQNILP